MQKYRPDRAAAGHGDELLEARSLDQTRPRAAQVVIDDDNAGETHCPGRFDQGILALLAFLVFRHLTRSRLAYVHHGTAGQVLSRDLWIHHRLPIGLPAR